MNESAKILITAANRLKDIKARLLFTLNQLEDNDVNWKPTTNSNSIANLTVHICGNLNERFNDYENKSSNRNRDEEFSAELNLKVRHIEVLASESFERAILFVENLSVEELDKEVKQGSIKVDLMSALFWNIAHYSEHLGQILYIAKMIKGDNYLIAWGPERWKRENM